MVLTSPQFETKPLFPFMCTLVMFYAQYSVILLYCAKKLTINAETTLLITAVSHSCGYYAVIIYSY